MLTKLRVESRSAMSPICRPGLARHLIKKTSPNEDSVRLNANPIGILQASASRDSHDTLISDIGGSILVDETTGLHVWIRFYVASYYFQRYIYMWGKYDVSKETLNPLPGQPTV